MTNKSDATLDPTTVSEVIKLARQFKSLADLSDALVSNAQVEQMARNATTKLHQAQSDHADATAELNKMLADLSDARATLARVKSDADKTKKDAAQAVSDAEVQATNIVNAAKDEAGKVKQAAEADVGALTEKKNLLLTDIDSMGAKLESKLNEYNELERKHEDLQRRHQSLMAGLNALQGSL